MSGGHKGKGGKPINKEWYLKGTDTRVQRVRISTGGGKFIWGVPDGPDGTFRRVFPNEMEKR
jgi:hypothetical protein